MTGENLRDFLSRQCALAAQIFRDWRSRITVENARAAIDAAPLKLKKLAVEFKPSNWPAILSTQFGYFRNFPATLQDRIGSDPNRTLVLAFVIFSAAIRALFVLTYPPNTGGFDANSYVNHMLFPNQSNLVHSGASTFILEILLWPLPGIAALGNTFAIYKLVLVQHVIELFAFGLLLAVVISIFGRAVGMIAALILSTSLLVLSFASTVHPQSLQASLFVVALCGSYLASTEVDEDFKASLYAIAGAALLWAIYIRFSTLFLVPLVLLPLLLDGSRRKWRFVPALLIVGTLTSIPYFLWHYSSTGTFALSYEKGWVFMAKLSQDYGRDAVQAGNGINSKRFIALSMVLPQDMKGAGALPFRHVDAVSREERAQWRRNWGWILTAGDKELDAHIRSYNDTLPANYILYYAPTVVSYYIGLPEADALATRVYIEWIRSNPIRFIRALAKNTWNGLAKFPADSLMPVGPLGNYGLREAKDSSRGFGFRKYESVENRADNRFDSEDNVIWAPGMRLFTMLNAITPPSWLWSLLAAMALIEALVAVGREGAPSRRSMAVIALGFSVIAYAIAIALVYRMRPQESHVVYPLLVVLAACGAVALARLARSGLSSLQSKAG